MTIGDVLAVVAIAGLIGFGWGATLLLAALAFSERTARAAQAIAASPGRCLLRGLGVFLLVSVFALVLRQSHAGPTRLLGAALWLALALTAAVGAAGIARLVGERIQGCGAQMSPFSALTRGVFLCVLAGLTPIIGWFLVTPLAAFISLGSIIGAPRLPKAQPAGVPNNSAPQDAAPAAVASLGMDGAR